MHAIAAHKIAGHWRQLALGLVSLGIVALIASMPQLLGDQVRDGFGGLAAASPAWLWTAALGFVLALAASGCAWRSALLRCGGRTTRFDSAARYGCGSLLNSFAPARLGTALRFALFARTLDGEGRIWTAGGVGTSVGVAHTVWLAALLTFGATTGALPAWPLAIIAVVVAVAVAVAYFTRSFHPRGRVAHVLDAFHALGRCPRAAAELLGWIGLATVGRVAAATAVCTALGISRPLAAALLIVPALELAGTLPLTPGNIGIASAAIVFALKAHGAEIDTAIAAGIAFSAVETVTSIAFGVGSTLYLLGGQAPGFRRYALVGVSAAGCLALGAAFGATVVMPLV
ncbi:MAG: lysylphosphatidylglycerol synthase domain-containing protein [Gaiellaceae bacterium]